MTVALEVGLLYAVMALGVYLTYRVLDFPDLTVDGSFTTGGAMCVVLLLAGVPIPLAIMIAVAAGMVAGLITGMLHVFGGINPLLSGILTQIALYSINLRILGKANLPVKPADTLFSPLRNAGLMASWTSVGIFAAAVAVVAVATYWFLGTSYGVAIRATGDNELMARSQGINTGGAKIVGLMLSNGLVALCGALVVQHQGFADISMGVGLIVAGLASVIIGQAIIGYTAVWQAVLAAVVGSVLYRTAIQLALSAKLEIFGFRLEANDMKLISAVLVVLALLLPKAAPFKRMRARRRRALAMAAEAT